MRKTVRRKVDSERLLRRVKKLGAGVLKHLILITLTIMSLYPLYFVIVNSVKTKIEYNSNKIGLPHRIVFDAYRKVFLGEKFPRWLTNTLIVTVVSVLLCLFFSSLAGFVISKMEFKGKRLILNSLISLMVIPVIVMIIPLFVLFGRFRLNNTYISVIVIYIGVLLPFNVYLLYSYFITVPQTILDSALIDGCGSFRIYRSIMIRCQPSRQGVSIQVHLYFLLSSYVDSIIWLSLTFTILLWRQLPNLSQNTSV